MGNDETVLVIIPSLVAQLINAEREKAKPLSEEEVKKIHDDSECVAVHPDDLPAFVEERGYSDIDPERCWEQWQVMRIELSEGD